MTESERKKLSELIAEMIEHARQEERAYRLRYFAIAMSSYITAYPVAYLRVVCAYGTERRGAKVDILTTTSAAPGGWERR